MTTRTPRTGPSRSLPRPHLLRLALVGLAAVAMTASACGGSSEDSSKDAKDTRTVSFDTWQEQVNDLCNAAREEVRGYDSPSSEEDYVGLEELAVKTKKRTNTFIDDVEAVGTPDEQAKEAAQFLDQFRSYVSDFSPLVTAAKAEDADAVEAAIADLDETNAKKDATAKKLGLDQCYSEDDTDSTTEDTLSDDPTTTTTEVVAGNLAFEEWSAETDAACARLTEKYAGIGETTPQSMEEAQALADDLNAFATELVAEWDRIGPPDGDTTQAQALYDLYVQFKDATDTFRNAVAAGDTAALDAASTEIDTITQQITPLAEELNVPTCGA